MAKAKTYRVRTTGDYRFITEANRKVAVEGGENLEVPVRDYIGPLDDAQLAAVMADQYLRVDELDAKGNSRVKLSDPAAPASTPDEPVNESSQEPAESDGEDQAAEDAADSSNDAPAATDEA